MSSGSTMSRTGSTMSASGSTMSSSSGGAMSERSGATSSRRSSEEVRRVQSALKDNGEDVKVDGVFGRQTRQALRDYQQKNGLQASGQLDEQTLEKLNVRSGG